MNGDTPLGPSPHSSESGRMMSCSKAPLVLSADLEPRLLEGARGLPLGVEPDTRYETWTTTLEPGP